MLYRSPARIALRIVLAILIVDFAIGVVVGASIR